MGMEGGHDAISNPFNNLRKAAAMSRDSLHRANLDSSDYFHVSGSVSRGQGRGVCAGRVQMALHTSVEPAKDQRSRTGI
ncbi:hypothetical protein OROMI_025502 [Orobanche minor]